MKLVSARKKINYSKKCTRFHVTFGWELAILGIVILTVFTLYRLSNPPPISKEDHEYANPSSLEALGVSPAKVTASQKPSPACVVSCEARSDYQGQSREAISNNFYKDKRDLNAQEGVWRASNVMAFYSLVMAALTAFGIYLLVLTWQATQSTLRLASETLKQSNEATEATILATKYTRAQSEPYLGFSYEYPIPERDLFECSMFIENFGKTPALDINCFVQIHNSNKEGTTWSTRQHNRSSSDFTIAGIGEDARIELVKTGPMRTSGIETGQQNLYFSVDVVWKTPFSDEHIHVWQFDQITGRRITQQPEFGGPPSPEQISRWMSEMQERMQTEGVEAWHALSFFSFKHEPMNGNDDSFLIIKRSRERINFLKRFGINI